MQHVNGGSRSDMTDHELEQELLGAIAARPYPLGQFRGRGGRVATETCQGQEHCARAALDLDRADSRH